jgi:hypothetical protein
MKALKLGFCLLCLAIFASNGCAMSRWSEARGVDDDLCYLRQAHLFLRFGPEGIDTDAALVLVAAAAAAWMLRHAQDGGRDVAMLASANLAINVLFFLSHPVPTRYYLVPIAMLSLCSMMFAFSMSTAATPRAGADRRPKSLGVLP